MRMRAKPSLGQVVQPVGDQPSRDDRVVAFVSPHIVAAVVRHLENATTVLALGRCAGVRREFTARAARAD